MWFGELNGDDLVVISPLSVMEYSELMVIAKLGESRPVRLPVALGKIGDPWFPNSEDVQQWAVYAAEHAVSAGSIVDGQEGAQKLINTILADCRVSTRYPLMTRVDVTVHNHVEELAGRPVIVSRGGPSGKMPYEVAAIRMHEEMLNEVVLLHELAHCLQPRFADRHDRHVGQTDWQELDHGHDEWFRATFCWLLEVFGSDISHSDLREAYVQFKLSIPNDDELLVMLARDAELQPRVQDELDLRSVESEEFYVSIGRSRSEFHIPSFDLGDVFRAMRRHHKITKTQMASSISRVQRCTTADITRMDSLSALPESREDRRFALYIGVVLGLDPRWLYTGYGLHRMEVGAKMADLVLLNRRWVETVRWMNRTMRARPPRWFVAGER